MCAVKDFRQTSNKARLLCAVALPFLFSAMAGDACASISYNGNLYDLTPAGSWTDAESFALSQGGNLVTIDDAAENEFLRTVFSSISGSQEEFWIGLFSPLGPGTDPAGYEWSSGSSSTYRNWRTSQPDFGSGNEQYAVMNATHSGDGTWDNYPVSGFSGAIRGVYELAPTESLPADGNGDGTVDGLDYLIWAGSYGEDAGSDLRGPTAVGDYNADGTIDGLDYLVWAGSYGDVMPDGAHAPEPSCCVWFVMVIIALLTRRRRAWI